MCTTCKYIIYIRLKGNFVHKEPVKEQMEKQKKTFFYIFSVFLVHNKCDPKISNLTNRNASKILALISV